MALNFRVEVDGNIVAAFEDKVNAELWAEEALDEQPELIEIRPIVRTFECKTCKESFSMSGKELIEVEDDDGMINCYECGNAVVEIKS